MHKVSLQNHMINDCTLKKCIVFYYHEQDQKSLNDTFDCACTYILMHISVMIHLSMCHRIIKIQFQATYFCDLPIKVLHVL